MTRQEGSELDSNPNFASRNLTTSNHGRGWFDGNTWSCSLMAAAFRTGDIFSRLVHCSEDGIDEALKGCELPDAKKANQLLNGIGKMPGKHVMAERLLTALEQRKCDITAFHYSTVINACGRAGDWQRAVAMIAAMRSQMVKQDTIVYNSAISACARAKYWQPALSLLDMLSGSSLPPDTLTFNSLINACGELWQLGIHLISLMQVSQAVADTISYNSAMRACTHAKQWWYALNLLKGMSECILLKDKFTYTTALSGLDDQWELAQTLLQNMESDGVQPDCQVFTAAVAVSGRAAHWQKALSLYGQALSRKIPGDTSMYNALITACGQGMEWEASLSLLEALRQSKKQIDSITLGATIAACCDARQWEWALYFLDYESDHGARLSTPCFNAILGGCNWDVVLAVLREMDSRRVEKDSLTFSTAITACERADMWDASFEILDERLVQLGDRRLRRSPFAPRSFLEQMMTSMKMPSSPLDLRRLLRACGRESPTCFRVNPLKADSRILEKLRQEGWQISPIPWLNNGYRVKNMQLGMGFNRPQLTGEMYFQEATSMLPGEVLRVLCGSPVNGCQLKVLDMCAAPGSKSTQLGSWLLSQKPMGILVANEPDPMRATKLEASLLRMGVTNAIVTCEDGRTLGDLAPESFDAILADVPCSCEGNARKDVTSLLTAAGTRREGPALHKEELVDRQRAILQSAWRALKPGGYLVYSTCTFDYWENEGQCQRFLAELSSAEHPPIPINVFQRLGLPVTGIAVSVGAAKGAQILPHTFDVEGFFVSCFRKGAAAASISCTGDADGQEGVKDLIKHFNLKLLSDKESQEIQALATQELGFWPGDYQLAEGDEKIWMLPHSELSFQGLAPAIRQPGILVATRKPQSMEQVVLADDMLLLAGSRAKNAKHVDNEEWARLHSAKEAGGKWSKSRSQRKARNKALIEAASK